MKQVSSPQLALLTGLIIAAIVFTVTWQQILSRHYQPDFAAYWSAGRAINEDVDRYSYRTTDPEGTLFRHAMFLNPPIVAQPFRLLGLLPYHTAKTVWYYLQLTLFVIAIILIGRHPRERIITATLAIIGIPLIFWPLFAELERGQTNMLLLLAIAASYHFARRHKLIAAGIILGLGSAFKFPLLLIFAIPLAQRHWRMITAGALTFTAVFTTSLIIDGWEINRRYFTSYLPSIAANDNLPNTVYSRHETPQPPTTRWEGRTYITRYPFQAPSGSTTRFLRSLSDNTLDRSLILTGAAITTIVILFSACALKSPPDKGGLGGSHAAHHLWQPTAWSAATTATLILHTLSWITNYILITIPLLLMWRYAISQSKTSIERAIKVTLLLATTAILIGDPLTTLSISSPPPIIAIALRNRVWLGGTLIWIALLILLITPQLRTKNLPTSTHTPST